MVDSKYSHGKCKTLKISIKVIIKNPEMLKFAPDHLKTKTMFKKNAVKKLLFVLRYVPDPYKTEGMCDEVILENDGMLKFVPDCY